MVLTVDGLSLYNFIDWILLRDVNIVDLIVYRLNRVRVNQFTALYSDTYKSTVIVHHNIPEQLYEFVRGLGFFGDPFPDLLPFRECLRGDLFLCFRDLDGFFTGTGTSFGVSSLLASSHSWHPASGKVLLTGSGLLCVSVL